MKKITSYIIAGILMFSVGSALAQPMPPAPTHVLIDGQLYVLQQPMQPYVKQRVVDWKPETKTENRYAIGISPLEFINYGLRLNFEYELKKPGNWLQFEATGYYTPWYGGNYRYDSYYWQDGWMSMGSDYDTFEKLGGGAIAFGYKSMFGHSGWYVNPVVSFKYYNIKHYDRGYVPFEQDGFTFYEYGRFLNETDFYKPSLMVNFGKHFTLSKNFYIDAFVGIGYTYSFYDRKQLNSGYDDYYTNTYSGNLFSYGYSGITLSGGLRFSFMWRGQLK